MTIDSLTLLPCPFCGESKAMMVEPTCRPETPYNPTDRLYPVVICMGCYAEVAGENEDYRGLSAITAWNTRTPRSGYSQTTEVREITEEKSYPDRYVITSVAKADTRDAGKRHWLYWSDEGGGWWQWGPEGWAYRFQSKDDPRLEDAMRSAPKVGPWYSSPDPLSIELVPTPAIVRVS